MSIQALRERKQEVSRLANKLLADKGAQAWSKDDQGVWDGYADEMERLDGQISAHQKMLDEAAGAIVLKKKDGPDARNEQQRGVEIFLRKNFRDMSPEEVSVVRNTMSTTTGSQGGYTVQTQVASDWVDAMKDYGGVRRVADRIVTTNGSDLSYPASDGTAEVGELLAQNASATSSDPSFGTVPLTTYKFGSKIIAVPIELIQDTNIDIVAMVQKRVRDRVGRSQNAYFSTGTGSSQPYGVTVAASVGKTGATGQTTTIIYDDLVDMVDSVDAAYLAEGALTWMFGQTLRRVIRKIKDTSGRPIWTPSYEAGISGAFTDELLGFPVNINNDMPTPAANAVSLSFGQHRKYMVRDTMELTVFRFEDSAYMSKGQIGFLAWARAAGNLLDTAAVKTYKHSAT